MANARIQFSTALESTWDSVNPTLREGELVCVQKSNGKYKLVVGAPGGSTYKNSTVVWDEVAADQIAQRSETAASRATSKASEASGYANTALGYKNNAETYKNAAASSATAAAASQAQAAQLVAGMPADYATALREIAKFTASGLSVVDGALCQTYNI